MRGFKIILTLLSLALLAFSLPSSAGGGPANVMVVVNGRSNESLEIGNLYRRTWQIPYQQLLTISTNSATSISYQGYLEEIEKPIRNFLQAQPVVGQITTIVLTRGIPVVVNTDNGRSITSLLAALDLPDGARETDRIKNPFYKSPIAFQHQSESWQGMYLVTTLHGYNTQDISRLISQGRAGDASTPEGRFVFQNGPEIRRTDIAPALDLLTQRDLNAEIVAGPPTNRAGIMGYLSQGVYSGLTREMVKSLDFRPGAIVDHAQNFGAAASNFEENAPVVPLSVGWYVQAGATGVHAVVGEAGIGSMPSGGGQRMLLESYTGGFSLAESYYRSLPYLNWQNVIIGDPLCSPYAIRPSVQVDFGDEFLVGAVPVHVSATTLQKWNTISQVDVYVDDQYMQTVYAPDNSQVLITIGGATSSYTIPHGASLTTLVNGVVDAVNNNAELKDSENGVLAVVSPVAGALELHARNRGIWGNDIPVSLRVESEQPDKPGVAARLQYDHLAGGGAQPTPARATLSFLGRNVSTGDEINLQILQARIKYTVPAKMTSITEMLDALVKLINDNPKLQGYNGIRAYRDPKGWPYVTLECRSAGEVGNRIPYQLSVVNAPESTLRGYPELPWLLSGGIDGTVAKDIVYLSLGARSVKADYLLDSTKLSDGFHRIRVVAYDGSAAQVQRSIESPFLVSNVRYAPIVQLPKVVGPVAGEVIVPVTVNDNVVRVDLYVDGRMVVSAKGDFNTIKLPLAGLGRGTHDLWAMAADADGHLFNSARAKLVVLVPPEISRITPERTVLSGGTTHRIIGAGFAENCVVKIAGVPVKTMKFLSPGMLDVTCDTGKAGRVAVTVSNPDGTSCELPDAFEYYQPIAQTLQISPVVEVVGSGKMVPFTVKCLDQYDQPYQPEFTWEASKGRITANGVFFAPRTAGLIKVSVHEPGGKVSEATVTVGAATIVDGILRHWLIIGPFPDTDNNALEAETIPEEKNLQPEHNTRVGDFSWRSFYAGEAAGIIDFYAIMSSSINLVAYANVYLKVDADVDAVAVYGSDDGIRIWLNGEMIESIRVRRPLIVGENKHTIKLVKGWNRLLVKVDQGMGSWAFAMKLQTPDGKPLPGLSYALDKP